MKKLSKLLLGLALVFCAVLILGVQDVSASSDKLLEEFFPKGIQKTVLKDHVIDTEVGIQRNPEEVKVFLRQNDEFKRLAAVYNELYYKRTLSEYYNDFDMTYGVEQFHIGVQFDISVDGSDWLYNEAWDRMDFSTTTGIPANFPVQYDITASSNGNSLRLRLLTDVLDYDNKDAGVLKGCFTGPDDKYSRGRYTLESHTINTRYRYYLEYLNMDTKEKTYDFSGWSNEVSIGKNGNQKLRGVAEKLTAPEISDPIRIFDGDGKLSQIQVQLNLSDDVTDDAIALTIFTGHGDPVVLVTEIAANDLTESDFKEYYAANASWLYNGSRLIAYNPEKSNDSQRYLFRACMREQESGKKSDYAYAVPQVTGLKAKTVKTTSIKLTWNKVSGAEFYEIYDSDNKLVGTSKTNSYTVKKLKAGTGYTYKVRAVTDKVFVGLFSKELAVGTKPKKATISKVSISSGAVSVTYKKLSCTGYEVQIATDSKFKDVKATLKADDVKTLTQKSENLGKGTYYVRVRAYFTFGGKTQYGSWSKVKTVK